MLFNICGVSELVQIYGNTGVTLFIICGVSELVQIYGNTGVTLFKLLLFQFHQEISSLTSGNTESYSSKNLWITDYCLTELDTFSEHVMYISL